MDIQEKILKLREEINYHSKKYYVDDAPEIEDYQYDKLFHTSPPFEYNLYFFICSLRSAMISGGACKLS